MGNKVLGRRSRSFYKGFNQKQVQYLKQKFQMISTDGKLDKNKFIAAYQLNDFIFDKFLGQVDFSQDSSIDEYEFICMVHSLCSQTIQQLGSMFFRIITKGKTDLTQKNLLNFTKICLQYNAYIDKINIVQQEIIKQNKKKFQKYDFDHNKIFDQEEFQKICLKDQDFKKWMYLMGFISKRQMEFQQDIYDLVDSDIGDQVEKLSKQNKQNISKIKQGVEHRIDDPQFQMEEVVGEQAHDDDQPWVKVTRDVTIQLQNLQPPNQSLQIQYVFGYRSFDSRNNVKFDSKGRVVYFHAAMGIVMQPSKNTQSYLTQHHEDITCIDVVQDTVVTGQTGAKPTIIMWDTNKNDNLLTKKLIITDQLQEGISNVCLSQSQLRLAAICNDQNHRLVVYDCKKLLKRQSDPTVKQKGIIAIGPTSSTIPFDLKFDISQKYLVLATVKQILFITFEKGVLNSNRGKFGNFTSASTLCLQPLKCKVKSDSKQYIISGMSNGSLYFWQRQTCIKAITGHKGSVSAICVRKDTQSFISGDNIGNIIIWNDKFQKQKSLILPKSNCPSNMVVALSCSKNKQLIVGTKASDIFLMGISDQFNKAKKIMSGHNDGMVNTLAIHRVQDYVYTGGDDKRLMKWDYVKKKCLQKQKKCLYPIQSIDLYNNQNLGENMMVVGYKNGIVQCFDPKSLQSLQKRYMDIKNPDEQTLNLVRINKDGTMCIACYLYPQFQILILNLAKKNKIQKLSQINLSSKVIAVDFDRQSKFIRLNTARHQYLVFNIDNFTKPFQIKNFNQVKIQSSQWATHSLPYTPQTQGVFCEGVVQDDIISCERSRKYINVFVVGDKYSKIKLFNYPSKQNKIYNRYVGHSHEVTGLQFDRRNEHLISIGGEQKSIIIWKYNPQQLKNQWFIKQLAPQSDIQQQQLTEQRKKKKLLLSQYQVQAVRGQQALATKAFLGQVKNPSDFKQNYNARRDNQVPEQNLSINHVFGIRNKYLNDQVRNQAKFSSSYQEVLFPTACLGVKMSMRTKKQEFYHAHRQDIVSFAVDPSRKFMATGQMAEKNPAQPLKKIVSIYVWDIATKQVLKKLDGFHTVAIVLLSFSPSSKLLFTCGNDQKNTFAIYDWISGAILYSGPTSRSKVNGIAWKTNQQFMTCGMDHVKFWTGLKSQMGKTDGKVQSMFSCVNSKKLYITGSGDGGIYNWIGNISQKKIKGHAGKVHTLIFFNDYVYSGGDDGKINAWKTQSNGSIKNPEVYFDTRTAFQQMLKTVKNVPQQQFGVLSLDFSQKKQLLIGTVGASIIYYNGKSSQIIHQGHYKGQLWALTTKLSKGDDNLIITGGDDKCIRMWDIAQKKQITRVYFENKVRGIDWSPDGSKVIVADSRAKLFLFNSTLTKMQDQYTGKPYDFNKTQKIQPFVEDIKFSPDSSLIVYGCHGKSMYMEFVDVSTNKLKIKKTFTHGTSALLHVDWSMDSSFIGLNTQAYQLLFYNTNGTMISASSSADQKWATWTRKFGFQVKGIFQGVDYSDVNTVCREPNQKFIAVGYDDQTVRIFRYPCYIDKQVFKIFYGHSSHVTRVRFTSDKMVSLGGNDRTIIVWNVERPYQQKEEDDGEQSDGLDDLEEDVDLPNKAIKKKVKQQKITQFYQNEDEGDQFMAIKPWLGAIKQPTYQYPKQSTKQPDVDIILEYVHGYRVKDCRQNLFYLDKQTIIFHAAAVLIYHNIQQNQQIILNPHQDDILSIDYHKATNQVITGQIGPKPLVCLFKNKKLLKTFTAPVKKGVLAVAFSPDGKKAACAGMDDDHEVSVLDLVSFKVLFTVKGTKKIITKIVWLSNSQFASIGISHYKLWTIDKSLTGKQSPKKQNLVSAIYDQQQNKLYTGASKGTILIWRGMQAQKIEITLQKKTQQGEQIAVSVVDCLLIQKNLLLAGTKNGIIFIIDKKTKKIINDIAMDDYFIDSGVKSQCCGIRAMSILNDRLLVGTLGAQIYQLQIQDLTSKKKPFKDTINILKCHFSPNNTWTNQVWGLFVKDDYIFTCSDDATVRCWSIMQKKLLSCASTNVFKDGDYVVQLEKDKKTNDFTDAAKSRSVCMSPDGKEVVVGAKNGVVRIYTFNPKDHKMKLKTVFRDAKSWVSDIKFGYNTLIIGSHDDSIYVYNYQDGKLKRKYAPLKKHSSYITHFDISRDSCFLQSTCGAYQLLFWDLNSGKQMTGGATMLRDERWTTWTCNLGWPVQGIYPPCTDGTFINSVDRSNFTIKHTLSKDDPRTPYLLAAGNDNGKVVVYNYPCTIKATKFAEGKGHSSHVTNVRWNSDDKYIISVGGEDQCLMYWKVQKKK